jgi:hypothetical protein
MKQEVMMMGIQGSRLTGFLQSAVNGDLSRLKIQNIENKLMAKIALAVKYLF